MKTVVRLVALVFLVQIFCGGVFAQFRETPNGATPAQIFTTPPNRIVAEYELMSAVPNSDDPAGMQSIKRSLFGEEKVAKLPGEKSGLLAAGLSLVIPGLGEYYVGDQIWRGAIFTVLEGGLWYGRYRWTNRGDDSLVAFHAWADSLWLPTRYSNYLDSLLATKGKASLITDKNNFSQINAEEDTLNALQFADFTHRLPTRGSQQYYELISKYIQFTKGWVDAPDVDPNHSPDYQRHADMRQTMNYQYEVADDFLYGVILNHILSAIDAALVAKDHNSALRLHGELLRMHYPDGTLGYMPTANLELRF